MIKEKDLTVGQSIILFAFVCLIIGLPQEIRKIFILNFGVGDIRPLRLYFQIIPILYIIYVNYRRRTLKVPHLGLFLLLVCGFFILENIASREGLPHDYQLIVRQLNIYVFFLMLVNFGCNRKIFYKVVDYAFYSGLLLCLVYWSGYLGVINVQVSNATFGEILTEQRVNPFINPNQLSYICTFTILLLIIKQLDAKKFTIRYLTRDIISMIILHSMAVVNASIGALIISTIFILFYLIYVYRYFLSSSRRIIRITSTVFVLPAIIVFVYLLVTFFFSESISNLFITKRLSHDIVETSLDLRIVNIRNAWANFLHHPFLGVGYFSAAKDYVFSTGTRSNNQYLHILASSGIFFFIIYLAYNFKLVAWRSSLLKQPEVALTVLYHAIYLLFRRPFDVVAIMGYIAYYFYFESKRKNRSRARQPNGELQN